MELHKQTSLKLPVTDTILTTTYFSHNNRHHQQILYFQKISSFNTASANLDFKSFLDSETLRQLRRELNEEIVDNEFNYKVKKITYLPANAIIDGTFKRRKALEEAMKTIPPNKVDCQELVNLRKELNLPPVNTDLWLNLPRVFTRSSARFELPMDSRLLSSEYRRFFSFFAIIRTQISLPTFT